MLAWLISLVEQNVLFFCALRNPETQKILWKISELSQKSENGGTKKFMSVLMLFSDHFRSPSFVKCVENNP